jgi:hypothetical protein
MKHFIKKLLREALGKGKQTLIFLRKTISPKNDLIRNFSCYHNAWFDNEQDAQHHYETEADPMTHEPRQDPVTKKWCGSVESGLSGYVVDNEENYNDALYYLNQIPHLKNINEISVFISDNYYLEDGSDGEDTFVNAKFLFNIPQTTTYQEFISKLKQIKKK